MKRASTDLQVSTSIVSLQPGLYAFRYKAAKAEPGRNYSVSLARAPIGGGTIEFFGLSKGAGSDAELRHLEDCAVVRVSQASASVLIAEYFADKAAFDNRVEISIERLDGAARVTAAAKTAVKSKLPYSVKTLNAFGDLLPVQLLGHIERRGDVTVAQGWLGDPTATARIEGFSAQWGQQPPANVELYYGCATSGQHQISMMPVGSFSGSRGKALPINALCFDLRGPDKERYKLVGEAVFAGAPAVTIHSGNVLTGPSGKEPLVALYLVVICKRQQQASKLAPSAWEDAAVTQVFRKKEKK